MRRAIEVSWAPARPPALEILKPLPARVVLELDQPGGRLIPGVASGAAVVAGQIVAAGAHLHLPAPLSGTVEVGGTTLAITGSGRGDWPPGARTGIVPGSDFPAFLAGIGLLGMGGARFPAALKAKAAARAKAHTLVINAVECEPGITIDRAILRDASALVRLGAQTVAAALGLGRVVLATADKRLGREFSAGWPGMEVLQVPAGYPGGAETLILRRLLGRLPPPGALPVQLGCLVHNVASLRAVGRAVGDGMPVIERPLTLAAPAHGFYRNLVVPLGIGCGELAALAGAPFNPDDDIMVAGGLMMGRRVGPDAAVNLGTTSLLILPARAVAGREEPCIRCGACHNACPLFLQPIQMYELLAAGGAPGAWPVGPQLQRCFLCGACGSVCPSRIPLAQCFRAAKAASRNNPLPGAGKEQGRNG